MCTLTLVPIEKNGFVLTSNRDEAVERKTKYPDFYFYNGKKMLFPKDEVGGGSWIGVSETKKAACLLNGAFRPHKRANFYRKSRGVVLKDLLASKNLNEFVFSYDLNQIEPFTIIVVDFSFELKFFELVWDGSFKHFKELERNPHLWSSSPLYSESMKSERNAWFSNFLEEQKISAVNLWDFHHTAGTGDKTKDLIIDRGILKTKSITQITNSKKILMRYEDLIEQRIVETEFN